MSANPNLPTKPEPPAGANPSVAPAVAEEMLTLRQAAKFLGLSKRTLKRDAARGAIQLTRGASGRLWVRKTDLIIAAILSPGKAAGLFGLTYDDFRKAIRRAEPGKSIAAANGLSVRRFFSYTQAQALAELVKLQSSSRTVQEVLDQNTALACIVGTRDPLAAAALLARQAATAHARQVRFRLSPTRARQAENKLQRAIAILLLVLKSRPGVAKEEILELAKKAIGDRRYGEALGGWILTVLYPK